MAWLTNFSNPKKRVITPQPRMKFDRLRKPSCNYVYPSIKIKIRMTILFSRGKNSVMFSSDEQKHVAQMLITCDEHYNKLMIVNSMYNHPEHTGGVDYMGGMHPHQFLRNLAAIARSSNDALRVEGTVHCGDTHTSAMFPGYLVQDQYIRCILSDGCVYHIFVDEPIVVT